jgi:hypothetical protein
MDDGGLVVICNENAYRRAMANGEQLEGIGFPRDCVERDAIASES